MVEANTVFRLLGPLAESARELRVARGQLIFHRTDPIDDVYCVTEGLIMEFMPCDDAKKHRVEDLEPYSLLDIGLSPLRIPTHHLSAVAVRNSTLLVVSIYDLELQMRKDPEFAIGILRIQVGKQRSAYGHAQASIPRGRHRFKSGT